MVITIGADWAGFPLKEAVKAHLIKLGHTVNDVGTTDLANPVLYVDVGDRVALSVASKEAEKGFVFCGTGMGVSIVANKHKGVYCALTESLWTARMSRIINNANVMSMGNSVVGVNMALEMVNAFLDTEFGQDQTLEKKQYLSELFEKVNDLESKCFNNP